MTHENLLLDDGHVVTAYLAGDDVIVTHAEWNLSLSRKDAVALGQRLLELGLPHAHFSHSGNPTLCLQVATDYGRAKAKIRAAFVESGRNRAKTAAALKIGRRTLTRWEQQYPDLLEVGP